MTNEMFSHGGLKIILFTYHSDRKCSKAGRGEGWGGGEQGGWHTYPLHAQHTLKTLSPMLVINISIVSCNSIS